MDERKEIMFRIYRACFCYPDIREKFKEEWKYVYDILEEGIEEVLPDIVLQLVDDWMDTL